MAGADYGIGNVGHGPGPRSLRGPARGGHATISYATSSKHRGERSFSVLKRIKNRLRFNIGQDKVSDISVLSIESSITRNLNCDQIIESFARDNARKKGYVKQKPCNFLVYFWLLTDTLVYFKFGSIIKRINVIYKGISALHKELSV
jgi:hypothetical protein